MIEMINEGDVVEVKLTDDGWWVEGVVVNDMETRLGVRLNAPVVLVEREKTIILKGWFREPAVEEKETWKKIDFLVFKKNEEVIRRKATS